MAQRRSVARPAAASCSTQGRGARRWRHEQGREKEQRSDGFGGLWRHGFTGGATAPVAWHGESVGDGAMVEWRGVARRRGWRKEEEAAAASGRFQGKRRLWRPFIP
jgi:hypothetical protein